MSEPFLTAQQLWDLWEPTHDRLRAIDPMHPTQLRVYRATSWMTHAESTEVVDIRLVLNWMALNALYGRWIVDQQTSMKDKKSLGKFVTEIYKMDEASAKPKLPGAMRQLAPWIREILKNQYLMNGFWQDSEDTRYAHQSKESREADLDLREGRYKKLLDSTLGYVYFLRCQLVHGGATAESTLNRDTVHDCDAFLTAALRAMLEVMIREGGDASWGVPCYPPVD